MYDSVDDSLTRKWKYLISVNYCWEKKESGREDEIDEISLHNNILKSS